MPDYIRQASLASFGKSPKLPKLQNTFYTLKYVGCVWVQISSQDMTMGEGKKRGYKDFALRISSSLSERWVCCVIENLSKGFLLE